MMDSFGKHEQHSHRHKRDMVVPRTPLSHLVVRHPAFAFRIFKRTFNPIVLALHPAQMLKRCTLGCIAQGNLRIRIAPQRLRHDQVPSLNPLRLAVPNVNSDSADSDSENARGGFSQRHRFPRACRQGVHKIPNFNALLVTLILCKRTSSVAHFLMQIGLRIFQIYMKIRVHIDNKTLAHFLKSKAKSCPFPVSRISLDPSIVKAVFPSMPHHVQGKLDLRPKSSFVFGHARMSATLRVLYPFLRQVKSHINRGNILAVGQRPEKRDLTIVYFAQSAQPLPENTNGQLSLFGKSAFTYQKACIALIARKSVNILGNMIGDILMISFRMSQKLLEVPRGRLRYDLSHAIHVLAGTGLHETTSVLTRLIGNIMPIRLEIFRVGIYQRHKSASNVPEGREGGCIKFSPSVSRMFSLGSA